MSPSFKPPIRDGQQIGIEVSSQKQWLFKLIFAISQSNTVSSVMRTCETRLSPVSRQRSIASRLITCRYLASGNFSDLSVAFAEKTWNIHRAIACSHSQWFRKAMTNDFEVSDPVPTSREPRL